MARHYPTSKTQEKVLTALGLTADNYTEAAKMFEARGLIVTSRREGRHTVPVVSKMDTERGGFNAGGDGESWTERYLPVDWEKLSQWVK